METTTEETLRRVAELQAIQRDGAGLMGNSGLSHAEERELAELTRSPAPR